MPPARRSSSSTRAQLGRRSEINRERVKNRHLGPRSAEPRRSGNRGRSACSESPGPARPAVKSKSSPSLRFQGRDESNIAINRFRRPRRFYRALRFDSLDRIDADGNPRPSPP